LCCLWEACVEKTLREFSACGCPILVVSSSRVETSVIFQVQIPEWLQENREHNPIYQAALNTFLYVGSEMSPKVLQAWFLARDTLWRWWIL
jgi:hypothetical protein